MRPRICAVLNQLAKLLFSAAIFIPLEATAQPATRPADNAVRLMVGRSKALNSAQPYKRVSVGDPQIAEVNAISPTSVLVTAKKPGGTQVILWDDSDRAESIDVVVDADLQTLQAHLGLLFPTAAIQASSLNGTIVLRGRVPNLAVADQAVQVGQPYGQKVVNMMEVAGGQQVMLQVRFAEVSRTALSSLGVNGAFASGSFFGGNNIGQINPTSLVPGRDSILGQGHGPNGLKLNSDQIVSPNVTLYGGGQIGSVFLEAFVDALRQNNLLRILAEPNLIAISGQEASFLAGGEFPIPVTQGGATGSTAITIEYREFGVKLVFVPVVLGDGRIRLKVAPEVSDLDFTTAVRFSGFVVPGLTQRKVTTTVELGDGQSFAVAGLLNNSISTSKDVVPLLGDLPVVGALFRSVRYQRKETELVVLVTPRLVSPMNPGNVPLLPGEQWRSPTESDLFLKQDTGGPVQPQAGDGASGRFFGPHGFTPATQPAR